MACANCGSHAASPITRYPAPSTGGGYASLCKPPPACPACGQLECLCRPLWTAGMIVSEDDLNRLDHYILAKQRLHNRHLHGTGVVAGLIVTCHPCGEGRVRVSTGYAIGPCGEDIVVCKDDTVDVCSLIQKCRAAERDEQDCRPWGYDKGCGALREDWVLAIRYDEQPSRNAPMLRAGHGGASHDCGCGGSNHGSCGCGGHGATATASRQKQYDRPAACAPSVICETYRYEVFRLPKAKIDDRLIRNPLLKWLLEAEIFACLWDIIAHAIAAPKTSFDNMSAAGMAAWVTYCRRGKALLLEYAANHGTQNCAQLALLCALPCPDPAKPEDFQKQVLEMRALFLAAVFALIKDCICLKLLPAVQPPASDPRIPLAAITVDLSAHCSIVSVCNWTPLRPIVLSATALEHWLRLFGIPGLFRPIMAQLCCAIPEVRSQIGKWEMRRGTMMMAAEMPAAEAAQPAVEGEPVIEPVETEWSDDFTAGLMKMLGEVLQAGEADGLQGAARQFGVIAREAAVKAAAGAHRSGISADPAKVSALEERIAVLEERLRVTPKDNRAGQGSGRRRPTP